MPSVCRAGVRRRLFKARVVGSKLRLGRGFETHELGFPHGRSEIDLVDGSKRVGVSARKTGDLTLTKI